MNYETAIRAARAKTPVVLQPYSQPGVIDNVMLGNGSRYIARFVPDHVDGVPWTWTKIEDIELAEAEKPAAEPETFPGMSVRELVDIVRPTPRSAPGDGGRAEGGPSREIRYRLEAIQMYQGTEAVIIRMILAGRRAID
jgi:hypothetical protein